MSWLEGAGKILMTGTRYCAIGFFVLVVGYVGAELWLWAQHGPEPSVTHEDTRAAYAALHAQQVAQSARTPKAEAEAVFTAMKHKIAALEKEVAQMKLERQTRMVQLQSYEQARLRVQDEPPLIIDIADADIQRKAKEVLGVQVQVAK